MERLEKHEAAPLNCFDFFFSVEGKGGGSRPGRGWGMEGDNFVTFAFVTSSCPQGRQSHPVIRSKREEIKGFPPSLKELIFSLNYESNGLGNSLYSVPDCLIPNKSFHVAPRVLAIRAHYRLIRALISGIT